MRTQRPEHTHRPRPSLTQWAEHDAISKKLCVDSHSHTLAAKLDSSTSHLAVANHNASTAFRLLRSIIDSITVLACVSTVLVYQATQKAASEAR